MSGLVFHADLGLVPAVEFFDADGAPLYDYPEPDGQVVGLTRHAARLLIEWLYDLLDEEVER